MIGFVVDILFRILEVIYLQCPTETQAEILRSVIVFPMLEVEIKLGHSSYEVIHLCLSRKFSICMCVTNELSHTCI